MSRFLVGCLASALSGGSNSERPVFEKAILCTRALCEFSMYCQYPVHNQASLDSMEDSLKCFHDKKAVFTIYRVGKKGMKAATALRSQLIGQRNQAIVEATTNNAKHRVRNSWNRKINTRIQELLLQHGHFNFPKIHLLEHFRRSIERFGALEQHSTSTTEISHKSQIKQGFLHSNRTGDYYRQILRYNARHEAFAVRRLNAASRSATDNPPEGAYERPAGRLKSRQFKKGSRKIRTFLNLLDKVTDKDHRDALLDSMLRYLEEEGMI
jgi:hypothetical protein